MNQRAKAILLFVIVAAFSVLIFGGVQISRYKPPVPDKVVGADGRVLFTGDDIMAGQKYYLARGGQHMGSVWGHGAYLAPDWSADALHRVALVTAGLVAGLPIEAAAQFDQARLQALEDGERARVSALVARELKENRYNQKEAASARKFQKVSQLRSRSKLCGSQWMLSWYSKLISRG